MTSINQQVWTNYLKPRNIWENSYVNTIKFNSTNGSRKNTLYYISMRRRGCLSTISQFQWLHKAKAKRATPAKIKNEQVKCRSHKKTFRKKVFYSQIFFQSNRILFSKTIWLQKITYFVKIRSNNAIIFKSHPGMSKKYAKLCLNAMTKFFLIQKLSIRHNDNSLR